MPSIQEYNERLLARYAAFLASGIGSLPTLFDNQDEQTFIKPNTRWARFSIRPTTRQQQEICATPSVKNTGVLILQVFQPLGSGIKQATELVDAYVSFFQLKTIAGVQYRDCTVSVIGRDGAWWQVNVTCPYEFETTAGV